MAKLVGCLDAAILENYARGALPEAASEEAERHLLQCETCYVKVRRLNPSDVLMDTLRRSRTSSLMTNETHAALVHRVIIDVCRLKPAPAAGSDDEPLLAFLAPAQQPDELGRLGVYRILRQLGAGGMGMVFLAEDSVLQRKVALKTILPSLANNSAAKARFLREARAAAAIEHEHIIAIHQVGEESGIPFIAMPFLQGVPLDRYLKARSPDPLPATEVCRIGQQIARGLAAAHARGLIHRDVKPGNIWLEGKEKKVKILDFGLARAEDDPVRVTKQGAIVGTPAYMAPEQARSGPIDYRADLFSLGCLLYEMSTGRRPFEGRDMMSMLTSLALDDPDPPKILNSQIPGGLSELIVQLLAKNPSERPGSGHGVARRLQALEFLAANPVTPTTAASDKRQPLVANVLVPVISASIVLLVVLAVIIGVGMLVEKLGDHPPAPLAEKTREQPREEQRRGEQPRQEDNQVGAGTVVPNAPPLPPLPPELDGKPSINLIRLANLHKDVVHGRWLVANKALDCNDGNFVPRIQFPYRPPAEYDFVVTFWQPGLRNGIALVMPNPNGGSFFWFLGNENGAGYGFFGKPNKEGRQPGLIKAKSVHTTVVQVRKGSVRALVDGKELMRLETDFRDLTCDQWRSIHNSDFVAVACDDPTVFYYVRIVEVSGKGKKGS
jgi:serine/threonine protein kinase